MSDDIKNITPDQGAINIEKKENPINSQENSSSGFYSFSGEQEKKMVKFFPRVNKKFLKLGGMIMVVVVALVIFFGVLPGISVYNNAQKTIADAKVLYSASQSQNLNQIKTSISATKADLGKLNNSLGKLGWLKFVPFVNGYFNDASHAVKGSEAGIEAGEIIVTTIEPYADILGLNGAKTAQNGSQTAADRLNFIVETVDKVIPEMDKISQKTNIMAEEFDKVQVNRYPEFFKGKALRANIEQAIQIINQVNEFVTDGKPVLSQIPYLLGINGERTYLVLFQNDKELRPTGGFITAYSIVKVKDGKFQPSSSSDIYSLDNKFNSRIPAPDPIKKYLPLVHYWNLRDMNLSPDFKVSMNTFYQNYSTIKSADHVDGVIAIDTYPLVSILKVIGRIGVPGFGNFSAENDPRCNCPVVIYELESYADVAGPIVWDDITGKIVYKPPHADNRKAIVGPLMNSLIANAMGQPKEKIPALFEAVWNSVIDKHVLFYMVDPNVQKAMESFNLAGRVQDFNGDYLHINDTNFAGAKANLYIEQEVNLQVDKGKDGSVNTLTIKYKNPQKHDGWLNGPYRDWVRVYVPNGSELLDSTGSDVDVTTSQDLGKTVFDGFFTLRPEGVLELRFKYKTPIKNNNYQILIQKQPGTEGQEYTVQVGNEKQQFNLITDKKLLF